MLVLTLYLHFICTSFVLFQSWARDNFLSFATTTPRQRNTAPGTSQVPEKNRKIVRPQCQCLDGIATINIVKWELQTTLWPDNMVTLFPSHF